MKEFVLSRSKIEVKALVLMIAAWFLLVSQAVQAENLGVPETTNKIWSQDKRYVDNNDKTITDTKTGLMWMKMDAFQHMGHLLNWHESAKFVETLNKEKFAGYDDWRLPSRKELATLYEPDKLNGSQVMNVHIDPIFAKDGIASLWSSEPNGQNNAFGVVLNTGDVFSASKLAKSKKSVRAVRFAK